MHRASGQIVQKQGVYSLDFLFDKYISCLVKLNVYKMYQDIPWYFDKTIAKEF